jgi:hypothetical protein
MGGGKIKWRRRSPSAQAAFLEVREERSREWRELQENGDQVMIGIKSVRLEMKQVQSQPTNQCPIRHLFPHLGLHHPHHKKTPTPHYAA